MSGTMSVEEAAKIVETHDWYGVDALWSNYPEIESRRGLRDLYDCACEVLDGDGEDLGEYGMDIDGPNGRW